MRAHSHMLIRQPPETVFDFVTDERNSFDPTITVAEFADPLPDPAS